MRNRVADLMLAEFPNSSSDIIEDTNLTGRRLYAKHVRDSQLLLLKKLKQWVTWYD